MSRLRPVPETAPRAVMYGRVSAVMGRGDDLTSPELQEHVVRDYCTRRGYEPTEWLCDVDRTGRSWSRRQVEHAVKMVEAGQAELIVVPRWSRFTRNLRDYVIQTARIEAAGGRLESALEETDPATAAGLLQRDLFAILAQWESRVKGEQWKETHERRIRAGLPHMTHPRFGYVHTEGRYVPDPDTAPVLRELYVRYLNGAGIAALVEWLTRHGFLSARTGQRWTRHGLMMMLDSGFAAGVLRVHGDHVPGAHEPVIDEAMWEAYQRARRQRAGTPPRLVAPTTALAGLVYCAACGQRMRIKARTIGGQRIADYEYRCERLAKQCPNPAGVIRERVEAAVREWSRGLQDTAERAAAELQRQVKATTTKVDRTQLLAKQAKVAAGLVKNRAEYAMGEYSASLRDEIEADLLARQGELQTQLDRLADETPPQVPNIQALRRLLETPSNALYRSYIRRVEIRRLPGRRQVDITVVPLWGSAF